MNLSEIMSLYKLITIACFPNSKISITQNELEIAVDALKRMADNSPNWSEYDKEVYKLALDCAKELTEQGL